LPQIRALEAVLRRSDRAGVARRGGVRAGRRLAALVQVAWG